MALAGEIAARGYACDLITAGAHGRWTEFVPSGVRHVSLGKTKAIHAVPGLIRYLRKERPVALLSSVFSANVAALIACLCSGVEVRCVIRDANKASLDAGSTTRVNTFINRMFLRYVYRHADAVIALSPGLAEDIRSAAHMSDAQVFVVPNPVIRRQGLACTPALPRDSSLILGCGRLEPQKDFRSLVLAFAQVRRERPAKLVILGEGSQFDTLQALATKLGIGSDVLLAGYSADPAHWMRRAKVFASTSLYEGFPNVLLEALESGCNIVCTRSSDSVPEILSDGRYGTIVPVGDIDAIAGAINIALDSRGPNHHGEATGKYDLTTVGQRYLDILVGPIADRSKKRPESTNAAHEQ